MQPWAKVHGDLRQPGDGMCILTIVCFLQHCMGVEDSSTVRQQRLPQTTRYIISNAISQYDNLQTSISNIICTIILIHHLRDIYLSTLYAVSNNVCKVYCLKE